MTPAPLVGVLALQGGFGAHARVLRSLGAEVREVRTPRDLDGLDGLVMPGGESTTMTLGIEREGLAEPLRAFHAAGRPIFGTCAGLIMLDRAHLAIMDIVADRNAFGKRVHIESFIHDKEYRFFKDEKGKLDLLLDGDVPPGKVHFSFVAQKHLVAGLSSGAIKG